MQFHRSQKTDNDLAKALGYQGRSPFSDVNVFEYIGYLRNKKVDELIKHKCADPLADTDDFKVDGTQRTKLFNKSEIPNVVSLDLAGFTTASGKRVPSIACKVVTTPARHTCVTVEATASTLDWLVQACTIDWQVEASELFQVCAPPVVPKRALPDNLPELTQPLSYILRGQLYCCSLQN